MGKVKQIETKDRTYYFYNDMITLKKFETNVWVGSKYEIKTINGCKGNDYGKDCIKMKFNSNDDFLLKKLLKFHAVTIIIRSVFEEGGKLYPQVFLDDLCMNYKNVTVRKN